MNSNPDFLLKPITPTLTNSYGKSLDLPEFVKGLEQETFRFPTKVRVRGHKCVSIVQYILERRFDPIIYRRGDYFVYGGSVIMSDEMNIETEDYSR